MKLINSIKQVFILCIALLAMLPQFANAQEKAAIDEIIFKVENHIVLRSDVENAYVEFLVNNNGQTYPELKCMIAKQKLFEKIMVAKAEIDSVIVDAKQIDSEMDRRIDILTSRFGGDVKALEEAFKKPLNQIKREMRDQLKDQMTVQRMRETITSKVKITPAYTKKFFNSIPKDSLPYFSNEVEIAQIVVHPTINKAEELRVKSQLLEIREKILAGEDFCKFTPLSADQSNAFNCGDLGWQGRGNFVPEFEAVALKLGPGEISKPVKTKFGYHLIKMHERRGNRFHCAHILIRPNASDNDVKEAIERMDSIKNKINAGKLTFTKAAQLYSDDKATASAGGYLVNPQTGNTTIKSTDLDPVIYFQIDKMKVGEISEAKEFRTDDGKRAVRMIFYANKIGQHLASLKTDYERIYQLAMEQKKNEVLETWFKKAATEVYIDIHKDFEKCDLLNFNEK